MSRMGSFVLLRSATPGKGTKLFRPIITSSSVSVRQQATAMSSSGPDRIVPCEDFTATSINAAVRLRIERTIKGTDCSPQSVPTFVAAKCNEAADRPALKVKRNGAWKEWSYSEYLSTVRTAAKALIRVGLEPRHGVTILGFNSPEWFFADLGAIFAGGVSTGVYPTSSPEACLHIANSCRANVIVVEDEKQLVKIMSVRDRMEYLKAIVQYIGKPCVEGVLGWAEFMELGAKESDNSLEERLKGIAINQCCHLVYTSGTTGPAKGVMLSHDNVIFTGKSIWATAGHEPLSDRYISYLPLSHVAAYVTDIYTQLEGQSAVHFAQPDAFRGSLVNTLREVEPTIFLSVPRVWEKIQEKMVAVGKANKGLKRVIGKWAKKTGLEHNMALLEGRNSATISYMLAEKLIFSKVKAGLGLGKCQGFYSAAAPMSRDTLDYFLSLDIRILEIYGMSECSGPQTSNTTDKRKLCTVGNTCPGFETKVEFDKTGTEEGEICMRGRNVMMGYLGDRDKTDEAIDAEGWLHSGDLGTVDKDGFHRITGRSKDLIVTAGGENVPPIPIEEAIKNALPDLISNVVLVGDRRKYLTCLVTLRVALDTTTEEPTDELAPEAAGFLKQHGIDAGTVKDAKKDAKVAKLLNDAIERANANAVSRAQRVQKWAILPKDFSVGGGELGPTMKVKRHVVVERYSKIVDAMYE